MCDSRRHQPSENIMNVHWLLQLKDLLNEYPIRTFPAFVRWPVKLTLRLVLFWLDLVVLGAYELSFIVFPKSVRSTGSNTSHWVTSRRFYGNLAGICDDNLAVWLLAPFPQQIQAVSFLLNAWCNHDNDYKSMIGKYISVCARCQFGDEIMARCLTDRSIKQIVVLGAGNDTRFHRFADIPLDVKLFEVDAAKTQESKVALLKHSGFMNPRVLFVPVDFEHESWFRAVERFGFQKSQKTLFIWEGVIYYLTEPSIRNTLQSISECASGSKIAMDFVVIPSDLKRMLLSLYLKVIGEPMHSMFTKHELASLLADYHLKFVYEPVMAEVYALRQFKMPSPVSSFEMHLAEIVLQ